MAFKKTSYIHFDYLPRIDFYKDDVSLSGGQVNFIVKVDTTLSDFISIQGNFPPGNYTIMFYNSFDGRRDTNPFFSEDLTTTNTVIKTFEYENKVPAPETEIYISSSVDATVSLKIAVGKKVYRV